MRSTPLVLLPLLLLGCIESEPAQLLNSLPQQCRLSDPALQLPLDLESHVLIGSVFDHSNETHRARVSAIDLALAEASSADAGLDYIAVHCDNQETASATKNEASVQLAESLAVDIGVSAIIGPAASSRVELVYEALAEREDLLIVSPSATSPTLIDMDGATSTDAAPGLFWRSVPPDSFQGRAIAQDMRTNFDPAGVSAFRTAPSTNVAVVAHEGTYAYGIAAAFQAEFTAAGGTVTEFFFLDQQDLPVAIDNAAAGSFDEVLFLSADTFEVSEFLVHAANSPALADTPLFLADSGRNMDVFEDIIEASAIFPNIRGARPTPPSGATYAGFVDAYIGANATDPGWYSFSANAYDAAWLVIYAHATGADPQSGTELARGLRRLSNGSAVEVGGDTWTQARDLLASGQSIDVMGASGALDFDVDSGETTGPMNIWLVEDGAFLDVATFEP